MKSYAVIMKFLIAFRTVEKLESDFNELVQQIGTRDFNVRFGVVFSRMNMKTALTTHTTATERLFQWCVVNTPFFKQIINGENDSELHPQTSRLARTLDEGLLAMLMTRLTAHLNNLQIKGIISKIDNVLIPVTTDAGRQTNKFKDMNPELYESLMNKINELNSDFRNFKDELISESDSIGNLRVAIELVQAFLVLNENVDLRDYAVDSVKKLLADCNSYRKKHG